MMKLLVLLGMLIYGVIKLHRLRERWIARLLPPPRAPQGYTVTLDAAGGRAGQVEYRQNGHVGRFDWELLAPGKSTLHIRVPSPERWDGAVPWAAGRRQQILSRVAEEVARKVGPECRWEIAEEGIFLHTG